MVQSSGCPRWNEVLRPERPAPRMAVLRSRSAVLTDGLPVAIGCCERVACHSERANHEGSLLSVTEGTAHALHAPPSAPRTNPSDRQHPHRRREQFGLKSTPDAPVTIIRPSEPAG